MARFMRTSGVVSRRIAGEVVLIPTGYPRRDTANFYVLNESAQLLWQELEKPRSASELAQVLTDTFLISARDAATDVERFLSDLQACGAVEVQPQVEET